MHNALRVLGAVAENVALPIGAYLLLVAFGWAPVWALVGAAGTSVLVLAAGYLRRREITTLGALVLLRFLLDIAVAVLTGDARLQLAKDFVITGTIGLVAAASLLAARPLIARIRRDLAGTRESFDADWARFPEFRALHRRLTGLWAIGLLAEAVAGVTLVYSLPLTAAVLAGNVLSPAVLFGLIGWTQYRGARFARDRRTDEPVGCPADRG